MEFNMTYKEFIEAQGRMFELEYMDSTIRRDFDDEEIIFTWLMIGIPDWIDWETHLMDLWDIATDKKEFKEIQNLFLNLTSM